MQVQQALVDHGISSAASLRNTLRDEAAVTLWFERKVAKPKVLEIQVDEARRIDYRRMAYYVCSGCLGRHQPGAGTPVRSMEERKSRVQQQQGSRQGGVALG